MKSSSGAERGFRRATIMAIVVAGAIVATYFLSGPHEDVALEGYEHAEESTTIAGAAELSRQLQTGPDFRSPLVDSILHQQADGLLNSVVDGQFEIELLPVPRAVVGFDKNLILDARIHLLPFSGLEAVHGELRSNGATVMNSSRLGRGGRIESSDSRFIVEGIQLLTAPFKERYEVSVVRTAHLDVVLDGFPINASGAVGVCAAVGNSRIAWGDVQLGGRVARNQNLNGLYRFEGLAPRRYLILINAHGVEESDSLSRYVVVHEGEAHTVLITPEVSASCLASGYVRHDGRPVSGATVEFNGRLATDHPSLGRAISDADGFYSLELPCTGHYEAAVRAGAAVQREIVNVDATYCYHNFDLSSGQIVVELPRAMVGAKVFLSRRDQLVQRKFDWRDAENERQITFDFVPPGDCVVALVVPVGTHGSDLVADFANVTVLGNASQQLVTLDAGTVVPCRFVVTRPDGQPAAGARVYTRPAGSSPECWRAQGLTDERGELYGFGLAGLGVLVEAESPSEIIGGLGYVSAPSTFSSDGRTPDVVDVRLVDAAGVRVHMSAASGVGGVPFICQLTDALGESSLWALRKYEYSYEHDFGPLCPGTYSVKVHDLEGRESVARFELEAGRVRWFDVAGSR